jgi:hypothetical protein
MSEDAHRGMWREPECSSFTYNERRSYDKIAIAGLSWETEAELQALERTPFVALRFSLEATAHGVLK